MIKYIIIFLVFINAISVNAEIITSNILGRNYSNTFQSKLKMNQSNIITTGNPTSRKQNRLYPKHCPQCRHQNPFLSPNELSALEKYALNRTYHRENDLARLERLENLAFGSTQYGDIGSRYANVENAILSRPQYKTKNTLLSNLANYFGGQTTGFTPNITPYNSLEGFTSNPYGFTTSPGYNNNNIEQYSNGIFGGGWGISGSDFGTGSSIRILD